MIWTGIIVGFTLGILAATLFCLWSSFFSDEYSEQSHRRKELIKLEHLLQIKLYSNELHRLRDQNSTLQQQNDSLVKNLKDFKLARHEYTGHGNGD
jgi:hypothetical protein